MKKSKEFLIFECSKLIWLHNENFKRMQKISNIIILFYSLMVMVLLFLNIKYGFLIFITNPLCYKVTFIYAKKGILHNEIKRQLIIFINELNMDLNDNFISYKKLELDKYLKTSPKINSYVLKKYNKKFRFFPLVLNITKIPKKYNLYKKNLLIRYFYIWKTNIIKNKILFLKMGPFYGNKQSFFQFHNVKIKNNNLEIKVEV